MEWGTYILPFLTGIALGALYFGGLWLTVQKVHIATFPAIWLLSSFVLRIGFLLIVFYWLLRMNWVFLVVAFIGFLMARMVLLQRFKQEEKIPPGEKYGI